MESIAGIVSWGAYVPRYRITAAEIAQAHGQSALLMQKSVPGPDEDAATMAVEASRIALRAADRTKIGGSFFGSESHPYAVKPTSTIVAEALGLPTTLMAADLQFACKAGTAALQIILSMVRSGMIEQGLGGGTDTAQGAPGEPLEYTAGAGAAAFVIGKENVAAEIVHTASVATDTPDFWRRQGEQYPRHAGTFTGEPSYFKHVFEAANLLMEKAGTSAKDYDFAIFHQPNGKFPRRVATMLGFTAQQIERGLLVEQIGNTYSAASLLGLIRVLEIAKPGQKILLTSYGSGAGADSFHIEATENIEAVQQAIPKLAFENTKSLSYGQYLLQTGGVRR